MGVCRYGKRKAEPSAVWLLLPNQRLLMLACCSSLYSASPLHPCSYKSQFHVPRLCPANLFLPDSSLVSFLKPLAELFPVGFGHSAAFPRTLTLPAKAFDL